MLRQNLKIKQVDISDEKDSVERYDINKNDDEILTDVDEESE